MTTGQAPALSPDGRSVEELVRDADILARDMLFDHDADPLTRLGTFAEVVEAALELWDTIPARLRDQRLDTLQTAMKSVQRAMIADPARARIGAPDPAMEQITTNLTRATELIASRRLRRFDLSPTAQRAAEGIRVRLLHTLYVSAHATLQAARTHLNAMPAHGRGAPDLHTRHAARHTCDRIAAIESDLSLLIDMSWPHVLTNQARPAPPQPSRIASAINDWDSQAHRSLASSPNLATLISIADAQRNLILLTTLVTRAAVETGHINRDELRDRLLPALDNLHNTWGRLAAHASRLLGTDRHIDPQLRQAHAELHAAVREISHDRTAQATPALIAQRVDLPSAVNTLFRSITAGANLAHVIRDAIEHQELRVAARPALHRAMATAAPMPDGGWVNARDVLHNLNVHMPPPIQHQLEDSITEVITAALAADSASTSLSRPVRRSSHSTPQSTAGPEGHGSWPASPARSLRPGRGR